MVSITCVGGPVEGVREYDDLAVVGLSWPLPEILPVPEWWGGVYRKASESELPDVVAEYRWEPDGA